MERDEKPELPQPFFSAGATCYTGIVGDGADIVGKNVLHNGLIWRVVKKLSQGGWRIETEPPSLEGTWYSIIAEVNYPPGHIKRTEVL